MAQLPDPDGISPKDALFRRVEYILLSFVHKAKVTDQEPPENDLFVGALFEVPKT